MSQSRGDLDLAQKAVAAHGGAQFGAQCLDRDLAAVPDVLGEKDHRHAALTQLALDPVAVGERRGELGGEDGHRMTREWWKLARTYGVGGMWDSERGATAALRRSPDSTPRRRRAACCTRTGPPGTCWPCTPGSPLPRGARSCSPGAGDRPDASRAASLRAHSRSRRLTPTRARSRVSRSPGSDESAR